MALSAPASRAGAEPGDTAEALEGVIASLEELKTILEPSRGLAACMIDVFRKEITEVFKLRLEIDRMKEAIESTKAEVAAISRLEHQGRGMRRVNGELDEVVVDTERATTRILAATEEIEAQMRPLRAALTSSPDRKRVEIALQQVVALYESCNFHDLTGQRIGKIVGVMKFLEERLQTVIDAWSGLGALRGFAEGAPAPSARSAQVDSSLLRGPKLSKDSGHASQDEIDAIFN